MRSWKKIAIVGGVAAFIIAAPHDATYIVHSLVQFVTQIFGGLHLR